VREAPAIRPHWDSDDRRDEALLAAIAVPRAAPAIFLELAKPRIVMLVLVTVVAGYSLAPTTAASWPVHLLVLIHALLGTALVASGACAFNQIAERDIDALMKRTAGRPIPSGRLSVFEATVFAALTGATGVAYLALLVNVVTAALAAATLLSYALVYTPLKRRTPLATLIGAVPGALPIVGGWTAAGGVLDARAVALFWILFLWQLPHFLALGWIYREEYARAGLKLVSTSGDGRTTFRQAALEAGALLPISLTPTVLGMAGGVYLLGALLLSAYFVGVSISAARAPSTPAARRVFLASLAYLPTLLALMVMDRVT
jgi:protoheme IX farnesyltransferase